MAKDKDKPVVDTKALNKLLGEHLPKAPDVLPDGTLKTARWLTGINSFDTLLNGGLPQGHTIAIGAEPGVGKTTMLIQALGNIVERYDKKVYYIDAEGGATYELINDMGYADLLWHPQRNPEGKFYLLDIKTIQKIATVINAVSKDPDTAAVVIDSDTAVIDGSALEEDDLGTSKNAAAGDARMWSAHGKKIQAVVRSSNMCLVLIHQARVDLSGFRPKIGSSGGNAAKHMASVEIFGRKKQWILSDFSEVSKASEADGTIIKLSTSKNRLTMPFAEVELPILFGKGISNKWSYRNWLEEFNVTDPVTGEVQTALSMKGGGFYTLILPSGTFKARGDKEVWSLIDEHYDEIVSYVEKNGGFKLKKADEE